MRMRRIALFTCTLFLALTACAAQADEVVITLGGDCVLGTREEWKDDAETFDTLIAEKGFDWCFSKISEPFLNDDISLVNLETVLQSHSEGHARGKEFTFRGDPSYTGILKAAGIEQVNIANNHYIDFGGSGRESMRAALEAALEQLGVGKARGLGGGGLRRGGNDLLGGLIIVQKVRLPRNGVSGPQGARVQRPGGAPGGGLRRDHLFLSLGQGVQPHP